PGPGAEDPCGWRRREKEGGEGEDEHETRDDEGKATDGGADGAGDSPCGEDRKLGRCRAGQQVARRDGVLEFLRGEPVLAVDAQVPKEGDVRGRAPESGAADPAPLRDDGS